MEVSDFSDVQAEFLARIQQGVYCSMATVDRRDRPRSRMMHPVWECTGGGPVGWVISWRQTHKAKHLARNPFVSLAYIHDRDKPVYIDCQAEWIDDVEGQWYAWEVHKNAPPPMGFDPEPHFGSIDHEYYGILKFTPWRVELGKLRGESRIWRP